MINAKDEFLKHTTEDVALKVSKAVIKSYDCGLIILHDGYSADDYNAFLNKLDFEYDNGFGDQHLYGVIWYEDGSWSERREYDGSEWWKHKRLPDFEKIITYIKTYGRYK